MLLMVVFWLEENKDIVKIYNAKAVNIAMQSFIYIGLKGCKHVGKLKRHYKEFKVAIMHIKGSLLLIAFLDLYLVISYLQVDFQKDYSIV